MNIVKTSYNGVIINLHYYFNKYDKKREIRFLLFRLLNNHRNNKDTFSKFKTDKLSLFNLATNNEMVTYKSVDTYTASFTFVNPKLINDKNYEDDIINLIDVMYVSRTEINKDIFERTKSELIEEIKSLDDNIISVAGSNVDKLLYNEEVNQTKIYGKLENYFDITYEDILNELTSFLNTKNFKLSILGNLSDKFLKRLNELLPTKIEFEVDSNYQYNINNYQDLVVDKSNKFGQTLVRLIYSFDNDNNNIETSYQMSIFANLLGVSSVSYLFEEIREAKGYCYYVGAQVSLERDFLQIISLVSSNKYLDAIRDIDEIVKRTIKDFDEERLKSTNKRLKETLLSLKDQAYYETYNQREDYLLKRGLTIDKMIEIINNTTKTSILLQTKSIKPVLKYALVGENDEEN